MVRRRCSLVLWLSVVLLAGCRPAAASGPVIVVEASYPGADARTVADAVAGPIEAQVQGVENAESLRSRCGSDGRYLLAVAFAQGTDAAMAQVLVQNRVALAQPILPAPVLAGGVTVRKQPAGVAFLVALSSPNGRFDAAYLDNYAAIQLRDELERLAGVGAVMQVPERDGTLRVWLDPMRLKRYGLTARDVVLTLQNQGLDSERWPGADGQPTRIELKILGRLVGPDDLDDVIVHTAPGGQVVRIRDLGRSEGVDRSLARAADLNGKPVALLAVAPRSAAARAELGTALADKLAVLRKRLPDGLRLEMAFDFTPNLQAPGRRTEPEYLLLDVDLPDGAGPERVETVLRDVGGALGQVGDVADVLTMTDNPFDGTRAAPCVLLRLKPPAERQADRRQVADAVRARLRDKVAGASVRVRFPLGAGPLAGWDYPVRLAVSGPDAASVHRLAAKLADEMQRQPELIDVRLDRSILPRPRLDIHVDRERAIGLGVTRADVHDLLRIALPDTAPDRQLESLKALKVRNNVGAMVPVSGLVRAKVVEAPAAVERLDGRPMAAITANPAADVRLDRARTRCEQLFAAVRTELQLPEGYRLSWLGAATK